MGQGLLAAYPSALWNDMRHGSICGPKNLGKYQKGKLMYSNGSCYEGEWILMGKKHIKHGKGKRSWADGRFYEGEWKHDKMDGKGKFKFSNGSSYEGYFEAGKRHGKGKCTSSDGRIYEGDYDDNERNGKGKLTDSDGRVYEGEFRDNRRHGMGKFTWLNGYVFEGEWKDDMRNGKGKFTGKGGVYKGEWVRGRRNGAMKLKKFGGKRFILFYNHGNLIRRARIVLEKRKIDHSEIKKLKIRTPYITNDFNFVVCCKEREKKMKKGGFEVFFRKYDREYAVCMENVCIY